jgi:hypothetical protein
MDNVTMKLDGSKLTITVDLKAPGRPSKTGNSTVIATTHGNAPIPGSAAKIGLNIYTPRGIAALQ